MTCNVCPPCILGQGSCRAHFIERVRRLPAEDLLGSEEGMGISLATLGLPENVFKIAVPLMEYGFRHVAVCDSDGKFCWKPPLDVLAWYFFVLRAPSLL